MTKFANSVIAVAFSEYIARKLQIISFLFLESTVYNADVKSAAILCLKMINLEGGRKIQGS